MANIETRPLNFEKFKYEPLAYHNAGRPFDALPEPSKVYLSTPEFKGSSLRVVRDKRIQDMKKTIKNTLIAVVGGLSQIHFPSDPDAIGSLQREEWLADVQKTVDSDLRQEYTTTLDSFVEDFDALMWVNLKNREAIEEGYLTAKEQASYRNRELAPIVQEVYSDLLCMWGNEHKKHLQDGVSVAG
ncbi:hypothetical protein BDN71DRAFT_1458494 [Pleurotus eryngii]|uniref:Uncharacterized protein n=1 Tax=Pleurotus eryngii TaxID=5323 RepID=A0A9P5ZH97_PLEER|nr:hypothetical protein BDN71DRAFT_1458494 [Pleurotus eryngii]